MSTIMSESIFILGHIICPLPKGKVVTCKLVTWYQKWIHLVLVRLRLIILLSFYLWCIWLWCQHLEFRQYLGARTCMYLKKNHGMSKKNSFTDYRVVRENEIQYREEHSSWARKMHQEKEENLKKEKFENFRKRNKVKICWI